MTPPSARCSTEAPIRASSSLTGTRTPRQLFRTHPVSRTWASRAEPAASTVMTPRTRRLRRSSGHEPRPRDCRTWGSTRRARGLWARNGSRMAHVLDKCCVPERRQSGNAPSPVACCGVFIMWAAAAWPWTPWYYRIRVVGTTVDRGAIPPGMQRSLTKSAL